MKQLELDLEPIPRLTEKSIKEALERGAKDANELNESLKQSFTPGPSFYTLVLR